MIGDNKTYRLVRLNKQKQYWFINTNREAALKIEIKKINKYDSEDWTKKLAKNAEFWKNAIHAENWL